jgi:hypothetical protein
MEVYELINHHYTPDQIGALAMGTLSNSQNKEHRLVAAA